MTPPHARPDPPARRWQVPGTYFTAPGRPETPDAASRGPGGGRRGGPWRLAAPLRPGWAHRQIGESGQNTTPNPPKTDFWTSEMTFFDFFKLVGKSILFTIFFVFGADFCDFWLLAVPERCPGDNGGAGVGVQSVPNLDLAAVSGPYGSSRTRKSPPYGWRRVRKWRSRPRRTPAT